MRDASGHISTINTLTRYYRKKNQMAGEIEAKKKEEESKAKREMYASPDFGVKRRAMANIS
jgi:hypothetical protein